MNDQRLHRPPPKFLFFMEGGRALLRYSTLIAKLPELRKLQRGDEHPVMVLPGFMAGDLTTVPLRNFLNRQGYNAYPWGLGLNYGKEVYEDLLSEKILLLFEKYNRKISLIGWSLGGIFAREIARRHPDLIRQVITMGTPFNGIDSGSNVTWVYELLHRKKMSDVDPELINRIKQPISVPCTNIFSKTDGVVPWKSCLDPVGPYRENIEVVGSHVGLGHHPRVLACIADRLSQKEGSWEPYDTRRFTQF